MVVFLSPRPENLQWLRQPGDSASREVNVLILIAGAEDWL